MGFRKKYLFLAYFILIIFSPSQKPPGFNPGMLTQKGRSFASLRGGNTIVVSAREEAPDFRALPLKVLGRPILLDSPGSFTTSYVFAESV
jgi:hypothetical protein